jgi:S1-C subfamily serine protease
VQFRDGAWRVADVVGTDVYSDLAVLRVSDPPDAATPLPFVDAERPVGTRVVAIGAPFDLGGSVSAGIISGQDRGLPSATGFTIPDAVQTDAAVNPGNSGGPLVTLDGEVVGVINSGGGDNIGFAISAALTQRVVPALIDTGKYDHSYIGVQLRAVSPLVAEANGLDRARGVIVVETVTGGPAAGVLRGSDGQQTINGTQVPVGGDVIVGISDTEIRTQADLGTYLALETSPGDTVSMTVLRDGERQTVEVTLGTRPAR